LSGLLIRLGVTVMSRLLGTRGFPLPSGEN
jgi:hypothetical protein